MGDALIDSTGLDAAIAGIRLEISELVIGGDSAISQALLVVAAKAPVDLPDADVIYIEHSVNASVQITAALSKKPHVIVLLGRPNTVNISGAGGQILKGAPVTGGGLTFSSGDDTSAVSRILMPDPDKNFPDRWRVI